jgi:hypothetical protein
LLAGGNLLSWIGDEFHGHRIAGIADVPVDIAERWLEIDLAHRRVEQLRSQSVLLEAQGYGGMHSKESLGALHKEIRRIRELILQILRTAGLQQQLDSQFSGFYSNWKEIRRNQDSEDDRRGAVRWLVRMLRKAMGKEA